MALKLNMKAVRELASSVSVPKYDRSALTPGILHIGVGNFHRAHQAVYLERLFNQGLDLDWGIIGAGIKPQDDAMRTKLADQDWLTTVVELDPQGYTASIIGSMIDFVKVDAASLISALSAREIRIVSLTITEGGYYVDAHHGGFDREHPEIIHDIENPGNPKTVFGILLAALKSRQTQGIAPFTILSCDNLPENGTVAKQTTVALACAISPEFAEWVEHEVAFPNSMVDCITPATSERERELITEKFGIDDASPVVCEPFRQWVLEDNFPAGRPMLEKVGVEFVHDVAPYELMKLRILNGSHAAIAYPAALLGIHFVHEAMAHPAISAFLHKLAVDEIIPTVPAVPGVDFDDYLANVETRFSNPKVGDTIPRLCLDGSNRQPKFILPAIADRIASGLSINGLALEVAFWCRYCAGVDDNGVPLKVIDEKAEQLRDHAVRARKVPATFLELHEIFGSLADNPVFVILFSNAVTSLWQNGVVATLETYLKGVPASDYVLRRSPY